MTRTGWLDDASRVIRRRSPWLKLIPLALACAAPLEAGCAGPPVPSAISGDPVCADFTLGAVGTQMRGGLRQPVRVRVLDGKNEVAHALIFGRRSDATPSPRIMLPDANEEYTVEWTQCENEHASQPAAGGRPADREAAGYDCGNAATYKQDKLTTKKGDLSTHALTFVAPPKPDCWKDERPAEPAVVDAGAPDASEDATAEATDAGIDDAAVTDASIEAGPEDAAAPADAGAAKDAKKNEQKAEKKAASPAPKKAAEPPATP
uniref:Uncharacterized protein n=1 Tax=Chondromyces catenulatus TaxID=1653841 RepID=A0A3S7UZD3_9BACT|nr:hypothetical protein [Chondromyces catenulatus]